MLTAATVKTMVKLHFATLPQRDRIFMHPVFRWHHDEPRQPIAGELVETALAELHQEGLMTCEDGIYCLSQAGAAECLVSR